MGRRAWRGQHGDRHLLRFEAEGDEDLREAEEEADTEDGGARRASPFAADPVAEGDIGAVRVADDGVRVGEVPLVEVGEVELVPAVGEKVEGCLVEPFLASEGEANLAAEAAGGNAGVADARGATVALGEGWVHPEVEVEDGEALQDAGRVGEDFAEGGRLAGDGRSDAGVWPRSGSFEAVGCARHPAEGFEYGESGAQGDGGALAAGLGRRQVGEGEAAGGQVGAAEGGDEAPAPFERGGCTASVSSQAARIRSKPARRSGMGLR